MYLFILCLSYIVFVDIIFILLYFIIKIVLLHSTCRLSSLYDIIRRILLDQRTVLQTQQQLYHDKSPSPGTQPEKATSDIKPFSELNLIDDYMFDIATMDLEICRSIIELSLISFSILSRTVPAITFRRPPIREL